MGKMQRVKGAVGEREVLALLSERLGVKLERNLSQTRNGGADCIQLGKVSLEVKRQERLNITAWWEQAVKQAGSNIPVLAFRQSRKPWTFVVDSNDVQLLSSRGHLLHMDVDTFCAIVSAFGWNLPLGG
jgi:hypothetical protein